MVTYCMSLENLHSSSAEVLLCDTFTTFILSYVLAKNIQQAFTILIFVFTADLSADFK